mgnify:CR=1 FL=1
MEDRIERRKPVNIVNEANRLALAGSCTCGDADVVQASDFAKVLVDKLHSLAEELADVRASELYGVEVVS